MRLPRLMRRLGSRISESSMLGAAIRRRAVVPAVVALLTAAVVVPGTVDAQERTSDDRLPDQLQGDWVRVESNNPRNNGMRIRVEGGRATITAMPPRGSSRLRVGQVIWDDLSAVGSLGVRGSDGAFYPSKLTMEGSNRLQLDIDLANSPGNDQTWERAGPSIDGDWVLYYTLKAYEQNWGIRVRVEGDRATIRYVPPTADREYRVGDIIWREFSPSDRTSASLYSFESLFGGSTYEPARMSRSTRSEDGGIRSIRIRNEADTRIQLWGLPKVAEEYIAKGVGEDEEEGALLDLPREPVGDPSAPEEDLEPSDDLPTVDLPEDQTLPVPEPAAEACLATSLLHDDTNLSWGWELTHAALPDASAPQSFDGTRTGRRIVTDVDWSHAPGISDGFSLIYRYRSDAGGIRTLDDVREHRALTAAEFEARNQQYDADGFRPADVEGLWTSNGARYAGVWVRNPEQVASWVDPNMTEAEYETAYGERITEGYRLVDMEVYSTPNDLRYAAIWNRRCGSSLNWRHRYGLEREQYRQLSDSFLSNGFKAIDFESYRTPEGQRYAAIWEIVPGRAWRVRFDRTLKQFLNHHRQYVDEGLRLIDFESYEYGSPDEIRYAGVWAENAPRYRYAAKDSIDTLVENHMNVNRLPGVAVAVIQDGDVVYRRGFGSADIEAQKGAHAQTVYLAASVSKVIGATLAARLEEQGHLVLSNATRDYLNALPGHHTHTVEQLLAKTGCVWHYNEGPNPAEQYYQWRIQALAGIWTSPLIMDFRRVARCTPGSLYHYSTHGYTFVGAVLEAVTGKDIAQLLKEELADPFGLSSMRAMFTSNGLPSDYDRAKPYAIQSRSLPPSSSNATFATSYDKNSWKVLGGGIEMHALDLATFGWKTLNGEIVSDKARDRMWTSRTNGLLRADLLPRNTPQVGLGWVVNNPQVSQVSMAWHGGSWKGARSHLRIWSDRDVVVAIMTNRRNDRNQGIATLANQIAAAIRALVP